MEGDFPAALDSQVAIPKGQCVAARNNDHKTTAALKTQSSSPDRSESGWTSLLDKKPPASPVAQTVKRLPAMWETQVRFLGREDPLEKETAIYSSTLAWKIPWMEEPGRLQSMGSQRVRHN